MIVQKRKGDWVLRVYVKNPDEDFRVTVEQYYSTRAEMRDGVKLWKKLTASSPSKVKIKTYRICFISVGCVETIGFYNTVTYTETR